jgi:hypothetical protein
VTRINPEKADAAMRQPEEEGEDDPAWYNYDFSLSNIGLLDFPSAPGKLAWKALYGPTFSAVNREKVIAVNTFGGRVHFTFICDSVYFEPAKAEEIIALAVRYLKEGCGGP